jgi:aspartate/methionine/tyrosine aminotransferase
MANLMVTSPYYVIWLSGLNLIGGKAGKSDLQKNMNFFCKLELHKVLVHAS